MLGVGGMNRKASLAFIFVTLAIDAIGLGIVIPVLPDVMRRFLTSEMEISRYYGYFIACYALMQFISSPWLGSLSDRFGRRPLLLLALLGGGIDYFFMAFAPTLPLLFVGRIISGVSGASFSVASAYIADISNDENRSRNFGVTGAGFGLGFIIGPAIGGVLASHGAMYPFLAAGAFSCLNFLFGLFVLPESLSRENRRKLQRSSLNPFKALGEILKMPKIQALIGVYVLMQMAGQTHPSIWTLYTRHRYGWTVAQVGVSLAIVGLMSAISQGGLTGKLVKLFGERKVVRISAFGQAVCFSLFALAPTGNIFYGVIFLSSLFWSAQPTIQSLISREVPPSRQGELQGSLLSLSSLVSIVNPLLMTAVFSITSNRGGTFYLPGSPYFLGSIFLIIAWMTIRVWERKHA